MKGFVKGLFLFTLGLLAGATLVDRMRGRASDLTVRLLAAADVDRGLDLAARGDLAGAREALIRANLLHPDSFAAHVALGDFYACAREWDSAARQYERAIESYPRAQAIDLDSPLPADLALAHGRLGRAAERLHREDQARRAFNEAIGMRASLVPRLRERLGTREGWIDYLDRLDRRCPQRMLEEDATAGTR